jgi:hypothetical protein
MLIRSSGGACSVTVTNKMVRAGSVGDLYIWQRATLQCRSDRLITPWGSYLQSRQRGVSHPTDWDEISRRDSIDPRLQMQL